MTLICSCGRTVTVRGTKPAICKCGRRYNVKINQPSRKRRARKPAFTLRRLRPLWKQVAGMFYGAGFVVLVMVALWLSSLR